MQAYAIKAAREGKERTSWIAPDERYEAGLTGFIAHVLDRRKSTRFIRSFDAFAHRAALMGALNSLTQTALKLTVPGVPDFYQGTEYWDLSLVDPDNRRPVDFRARATALSSFPQSPDWSALARNWKNARIKLALTRRLLALRHELPQVFAEGDYQPVEVSGPHRREIIAFARAHGHDAVIVAVGRLFARATGAGRHWPRATSWQATLNCKPYISLRNILDRNAEAKGPRVSLGPCFAQIPVAIFAANYDG
jgi:(1->4)-alpha-D-glucan 1-alpha-D-glucosylmutase